MALRILQFGRTGQVGLELLIRGLRRGHQITALGRDVVDFAQPARVPRVFASAGPVDLVINGAAYTAVDKAEAEPERADLVNAESVAVLAETCAKRGIPLIHLSTDYVFDGKKPTPYLEDDTTAPLNAYGRSKLRGEIALRGRQPEHIILRTSWIYSAHGTNFVKTMLRLGAERAELKIVDDQWGAPTAAGDIAEACLTISERIARDRPNVHWGTYHCAAQGETTWARLAQAIFDDAQSWAGTTARIVSIPTSGYPTAALRPLNSRMDCTKISTAFGITGRPWRDALSDVLHELKRSREVAAQ